jgi:hypothetical protein
MGIPVPRFPIIIYDICIQCDIRYTYSFGQENTIFVHTINVSYTICVFWINVYSDVRFTNFKNFDKWLYSFDRWSWLCVIQYFVWWLILRYCYTYDIYKNIPSRNHVTFITLCRFRICKFQDISATLFQAGMLQHE